MNFDKILNFGYVIEVKINHEILASEFYQNSFLWGELWFRVPPSSSCFPAKISLRLSGGSPSLSWILNLILSMMLLCSTLRITCLYIQSFDEDFHSSASVVVWGVRVLFGRTTKDKRIQVKSSEELQLNVSESTNSKLMVTSLTNQEEALKYKLNKFYYK